MGAKKALGYESLGASEKTNTIVHHPSATLPPGHYPNMSMGEFQQMMGSSSQTNEPRMKQPSSKLPETPFSMNQQLGFPPEDKDC
jgi:hypothetical protein